jgi:cysteine desulfurase
VSILRTIFRQIWTKSGRSYLQGEWLRMIVYLDYMASTPLDPQVWQVMTDCLGSAEHFGNPASQSHRFGWQASESIESARQQVADLIQAQAREIVWTSGATEAVNLALKGAAFFYQRKGRHLITLRTEHKAVLNTCAYLESMGFSVTYLETGSNGLLDLAALEAAIRPDTILVSLMWVNNETGVIQDMLGVSAITRRHGIILHSDAAQAAGKVDIDVCAVPVDLLSLSAHKIYGPKGIGALYLRRTPRIRLAVQMHGGEQEHGLRSGTLPTHQVVGMGRAFALAKARLAQDNAHVARLSARLWQSLHALGGVTLNGDLERRIPHCLNVSIEGIEAETLVVSLTDLAISTGSACHSAHATPSHVLTAMGVPALQARSALRLSLGRFTTLAEIDQAAAQITACVRSLRQLSPLSL